MIFTTPVTGENQKIALSIKDKNNKIPNSSK